MIFFHIECMSSTGETHTRLCAHPEETVFVKLCDQQSVHAFNWKKKKQESKPDNTFSGQTKWLVSMGIKFVNTSSTHTHKVPHTHFITTRCHNTSFSAASIKPHWQEPCPLLSNCHAEMFTFTYKWPGVMLCHIMFHGQIMCPISQSSLQPLSPLSSLYSHNDTQAPWPQKGNLVSPQWSATLN